MDEKPPSTNPAQSPWKIELAGTLKLAGPVVASELGWMVMGTVDTWMVGPLGASAVGASGLANMLFFVGIVFGFGLLLGLDPMVSQAFGAGDRVACRKNLWQGLYAAAILTPIAMAAVWAIVPMLPAWEIQEEIASPTGPFLRTLSWSIGPLFAMTVLRHYLQGMGRVRWLMVALLVGNAINLLGNWVLIDGRLGFPRLGLQGSAWSTVIARMVIPVVLAIEAWWITPRTGRFGGIDGWEWPRMKRLLKLGLPPAVQLTLEVGVFGMAAVWAGQISAQAMAAHQIVMNLASTTFMVPLGIASAGSVRVGQAIGRKDPAGARLAGWLAIAIGIGFMAMAGMTLAAIPRWLIGEFSTDPVVLAIGVPLVYVAAVFQLFDGAQVVSSGALRGAGETRWPMVGNLCAHWLFGLPIGYLLGIRLHWGALGIWIGLSAGLIAVGCGLIGLWAHRSRRLERVEAVG